MKCNICSTEMIWISDTHDEEEDIVSAYYCPKCGYGIEIEAN